MQPSFSNAEGGIRTHAPSRTNGFQDRLVMTTSIPLHIFYCCRVRQRLSNNTTPDGLCQHLFSIILEDFSQKFLQYPSLPES